jgi:hypothetical protein
MQNFSGNFRQRIAPIIHHITLSHLQIFCASLATVLTTQAPTQPYLFLRELVLVAGEASARAASSSSSSREGQAAVASSCLSAGGSCGQERRCAGRAELLPFAGRGGCASRAELQLVGGKGVRPWRAAARFAGSSCSPSSSAPSPVLPIRRATNLAVQAGRSSPPRRSGRSFPAMLGRRSEPSGGARRCGCRSIRVPVRLRWHHQRQRSSSPSWATSTVMDSSPSCPSSSASPRASRMTRHDAAGDLHDCS